MDKSVKARWLAALLACIVSTVFVASRTSDPNDAGVATQGPEPSDVVFRHFL